MNENGDQVKDGAVAIDNSNIVGVDKTAVLEKEFNAKKVIDGTGKALFPGFINSHGHLFQNLLKGLGRDKKLMDWLNSSIKKALPYIEADDVLASATAGCMESMESGVTTFLDYMYCHGTSLEDLDEAVIAAFRKTGMRGMLGRAHTQVEGLGCPVEESEDDFFKQIDRLAAELKDDEMISLVLTPGIIWDHTVEGFKKCREYADKYGLLMTMHTIETDDDDDYSFKTYGKTTMEFLDEVGILGPDFICVHFVKASEKDIAIMKKNDCKIVHCPVSNMILASGFAPIDAFHEAGLDVGLATDGAASNDSLNYLEVLKMAATIHKGFQQDATVLPAEMALRMATIEGAKVIGREKDLGSIEVGKKADCFIFNPAGSLAGTPCYDFITNLVYCSNTQNIESVIIDGKLTIENGEFINIKRESIIKELQAKGDNLRDKTAVSS